jgi:hypothetical protein
MGHIAKVSSTLLTLCFILLSNHGLSAQASTASIGVQTGTREAGAKKTVDASDSAAARQDTSPLPAAPRVTYQNGLLSISATNSTFSELFRAVQKATGTVIEYPATAANDRIAVELGPGKPKDVIKDLLDGSSFDYILTGVPGDSGRVQRLVLMTQRAPQAGTVSSASSASHETPVQVGEANPVKPKTTTIARRTTSDGRPAEPAILPIGNRNQAANMNTPVSNTENDPQRAAPNTENDPQRTARGNLWMQIDKEHAQRMADPANKDAPPPSPPPMEPPPPTE